MNSTIVSWNVHELENGVYQLTIDTSERWVDYHAYSDTKFLIGETDLEIPEFLPKTAGWSRSSVQEKDQICFYWMPRDWFKAKKFVMLGIDN